MINLQNSKFQTISRILLGALMLSGCTRYHTYEIGTNSELVDEINQKSESSSTKIRMNDGYKYSATKLHFQPDSTFWYAGDGILMIRHPSSDINKITLIDRSRGAWYGLAIGAGLGFVIGSLFGLALADWGENPMYADDDSNVGEMLSGGVAVAAFMGLIGLPAGWVIGQKDIYTIVTPDTGAQKGSD